MSAPESAPQEEADAAARLAAIVDSSFDAIISKDLNSTIRSWNQAAERLFGYTADEAIGRSILMLIPDHLRSEEADIIGRIKAGDRVASYETTRVRKDGTMISVSLTVSPIRNPSGVIVGASKIARDITAAKDSERRIRTLMREVNHRVKNQYAVILAIIRETGKTTPDPKEFAVQVRERIVALSRSHDLLVTSDWAGANLIDLVQEQLKPFGQQLAIEIGGPDIVLQANALQNLGMALHELGTNSAKYGFLSGGAGSLSVTWSLTGNEAGGKDLNFVWAETFEPAARKQARRSGFGSVVLQRITPVSLGGKAVLEHEDGRISWSLSVPVDAITADMGEDG